MRAEKLPLGEKLSQRCSILAEVVLALRGLYRSPTITRTQKDLLETIIGAAIWYLPEPPGLFTGKISAAALDVCKQDRKQWPKLTKEHCFPRKRAGADLLQNASTKLTGEELLASYQTKYGKYNRVTKRENRALISDQKRGMSTEDCYTRAQIVLVDAPPEFLTHSRRKKKSQ